MDIGGWLRSLGLEEYEAAFHANAVDADVLHDLTDQDLKKLGVPLGHRRKLLRAIAALDGALAPASAPRPTPLPIPPEAILAAAAAGASRERQQGEDHSVSPSPQPSSGSPGRDDRRWVFAEPRGTDVVVTRPMTATMTISRQPRLAMLTVPMIVTMISRARAGGIVSS